MLSPRDVVEVAIAAGGIASLTHVGAPSHRLPNRLCRQALG